MQHPPLVTFTIETPAAARAAARAARLKRVALGLTLTALVFTPTPLRQLSPWSHARTAVVQRIDTTVDRTVDQAGDAVADATGH